MSLSTPPAAEGAGVRLRSRAIRLALNAADDGDFVTTVFHAQTNKASAHMTATEVPAFERVRFWDVLPRCFRAASST